MVLDLLLGLVLVLSFFRGWHTGLVSVVLSLVMLVASMYLASLFGGWLGALLGISPRYLSNIVGFAVAFALLMMLGNMFKHWLKPKRGLIGGADKILGAGLGVLRGALVLSLILVLLRVVHMPPSAVRESSRLYPILVKIAPSIVNILRPVIRDRVEV